MSEKKYSKQHEWVTIEGDVATIGITTHAAEMLGDVAVSYTHLRAHETLR